MGLEPTNRFLRGYGLAIRWLTIRRTLPYFSTVSNLVGESERDDVVDACGGECVRRGLEREVELTG